MSPTARWKTRCDWHQPPLLFTLIATSTGQAQPPDVHLAARCAELGGLFERYGTRRSEGSGGPDMIRLGAGIDCQKGRFAQGINALEDLLKRNRIPYPPALS